MLLVPRWRPFPRHAVFALVLAVLAGCAAAPPKSSAPSEPVPTSPRAGAAPASERDGAEARPPADLATVPDAEPKIEPIRVGGPNMPYATLGRSYVPLTDDRPFSERGLASWYGKKFHGRRTASGEPYDMYSMTAAHPTLPIPSYVRVRNPANDREVVVRVNDRGPFHSGRVIDLSYTAAFKLGLLRGVATVELTRITFDEIRTGAWRKGVPVDAPPIDRPAVEAAAATEAASPSSPAASAPLTASARGFWVQLGAFRQREGADSFLRRVSADLDWLAPLLAVFSEPSAFRLQAGPYASRDEAQGVARRIREALQLVPTIVERR